MLYTLTHQMLFKGIHGPQSWYVVEHPSVDLSLLLEDFSFVDLSLLREEECS